MTCSPSCFQGKGALYSCALPLTPGAGVGCWPSLNTSGVGCFPSSENQMECPSDPSHSMLTIIRLWPFCCCCWKVLMMGAGSAAAPRHLMCEIRHLSLPPHVSSTRSRTRQVSCASLGWFHRLCLNMVAGDSRVIQFFLGCMQSKVSNVIQRSPGTIHH